MKGMEPMRANIKSGGPNESEQSRVHILYREVKEKESNMEKLNSVTIKVLLLF